MMKSNTLYGIGVGPGDPELLTMKAALILSECKQVIVPKAKSDGGSVALRIAERYIGANAEIREMVFPMTTDKTRLAQSWRESAQKVAELLALGDTCFLTLGDAFLYSTYIYLLRALEEILPSVRVVTVPGITSFSASAALTRFPLGEGKEPITIIPTDDDLSPAREAILRGGTVVLMKIGHRLPAILELLEEVGALESAVLVQKAGQADERIERNLRELRQPEVVAEAGYLSVILVHTPMPLV